ncbi:hypothetical protein PV721_30440 [Streptomyces sp. MB09-01]|uniref:hypothetical protein n=1 Tax=Streptomyces sp. MB09-01 TaxID=3028666 RepID=UPI0029B2EAF4|nr:hypothetical protein [Streptomyces sp. MB09-01]MDX3538587.1 hypothetical protein [Streptomyces sp. MB09-01]
MPLRFIKNHGQAPAAVDHYLHGSGTSVAFGKTGLTYSLTKAAETPVPKPAEKPAAKPVKNPAET